MKKTLLLVAGFAGAVLLSGCGGGYPSGYYAPQPQQKSLNQVAKESANQLDAKETAQLERWAEKNKK